MPLVHVSDVLARGSTGEKRLDLIGKRIHDAARPMPPPPNPALDAADLAVLDRWVAAGAPPAADGVQCIAPVAPVDAGRPSLNCKPDVTMLPASPYAMPKEATDLYICYGFDAPITGKRHLTAIAPKLDNTKIIHHLVLYDTDVVASTTPGSCDIAGLAKARLLYGWAPGTGNLELPIEAGYPIDGTRHFVVQIHYNNVKQLDGQTDNSGFEFCTPTSSARTTPTRSPSGPRTSRSPPKAAPTRRAATPGRRRRRPCTSSPRYRTCTSSVT